MPVFIEVDVKVLVGNREVPAQRSLHCFRGQLFLLSLIANSGRILIKHVAFRKRLIRYGESKLAGIGLGIDDPIRVLSAPRFGLKSNVLNQHAFPRELNA